MADKEFALIGPGKVGIALAYLLRQRGYRLRMVVGRSESSLDRAKIYLQGGEASIPAFTTDLAMLPTDLDFILVAVKDGQIGEMVQNLWYRNLLRPKQVVIHLSGALPSDIGHTTKMAEVGHLSLHPLQACPTVEAGILRLPTAVWSLEGDPLGLALGQLLLEAIPARWFIIGKDQKPLYHAAATVASNYLVTITKIAMDLLVCVGIPPELAQEALLPLILGTIENLREKNPAEALTGPIARGDASTVATHMQAIASTGKSDWVELYRVLGKATTAFALINAEARENLIHSLTNLFSSQKEESS